MLAREIIWLLALAATVVIVGTMFIPITVHAHDAKARDMAAAGDPDRADWFSSLKQPGNGNSCCNQTDCHATRAEWRGSQWWAELESYRGKEWVPVPADRVLKNPKSIDGDAYICNSMGEAGGQKMGSYSGMPAYTSLPSEPFVYCFIPPPQSF